MVWTDRGERAVDRERVARVRASIDERAHAEGLPLSIRHVCLACRAALDVGGVGVSLLDGFGVGQSLVVTDPCTEHLADVQITVGEGPGVDALGRNRPVLVPDLAAADTQRRWPLFAPAAYELGARAVFAFPLQLGVIVVGVLEINRTAPGRLSPDQLAGALLYADAALIVLLELDLAAEAESSDEAARPVSPSRPINGFVDRWSEVHQATGMVSVQLGTSITEAFVRLRAHAYASDRRLSAVAGDVVTRRLRFDPDPGANSVPTTE
jgi:hypothetical protein